MANVIRTRFQGKDGYLNIDKGVLTLYGGSKPAKWDITKRENTKLLREFLNTAYAAGKGPSLGSLFHATLKNKFRWTFNDDMNLVMRFDKSKQVTTGLFPNTDHTKAILSAMVRANVK